MAHPILETAYGHACCVAAYLIPSTRGAYHAHLVQQLGASAPSIEDIVAAGEAVNEFWQMGSAPRCYVCGANVSPGTVCACVTRALPFRATRDTAEGLAARGDSRPACRFACVECGAMGTMNAKQLLRTDGVPYKRCAPCVRAAAVERSRQAAPVQAAVAGLITAQVAHSRDLLAAAQTAYVAAQSAYEAAAHAAGELEQALDVRAKELQSRVSVLEQTRAVLAANGVDDTTAAAMTAPMRAASDQARTRLAEAQARFDVAREEARGLFPALLQASEEVTRLEAVVA